MTNTLRIALLEASHWHVPLYLAALERPDVKVVAVSDRNAQIAAKVAARFGCACHESFDALLRVHELDFAFVFGRHAEMPRIGAALLERGVPFALEKPCGVSAADVAGLRRQATAAGIYVAVPFIFRLSDLLREIEAAEGALPARFQHIGFRFIVGPPSRYVESGSPWMLDPAVAGGGCTINVGTHFIDLFRRLTGAEVRTVAAVLSHRGHGAAVEDHSVLVLTATDGTVGVIETGYTFPGAKDPQREFSLSVSSQRCYYQLAPDGLQVWARDSDRKPARSIPIVVETDDYYPRFVERVLSDLRSGSPPLAGLADAEAMMRVVDAAYASARAGGSPVEVRR